MKLHARVVLIAAWVVALPLTLIAQDTSSGKDRPLAFRTAIELALKNSATTGLSQADLQRARSAVRQAHDVFLPQMCLAPAWEHRMVSRSAWKARRLQSLT